MQRNLDKGISDISITVDDLSEIGIPSEAQLGGERLAGFSLACWDRQNGIRGGDCWNIADSDDGSDIGDEGNVRGWRRADSLDEVDDEDENDEEEDESENLLEIPKEKPWIFPDRNERKVRFNPDMEQIRCIERVDVEDYPSLYYCVHELQKMADEYRREESNARWAQFRMNN